MLGDDDIDVFFDVTEFAEPVTFHLGDDNAPNDRTITAIFDDEFTPRTQGTGIVLDTTDPMLTCKSTDVADIQRETMVTVRGALYSVVQLQPDGQGMTVIVLAHDDGEDE